MPKALHAANEKPYLLDGDGLVVRQVGLAFMSQKQVHLTLGFVLRGEGGCCDLLLLVG